MPILELPLSAASIASLVNSTVSSNDFACSIASRAVIILVVLAGYHFFAAFFETSTVPFAKSITTASFAVIDGHFGQGAVSAETSFISKTKNKLITVKIIAKLLFIYNFFINFSKTITK